MLHGNSNKAAMDRASIYSSAPHPAAPLAQAVSELGHRALQFIAWSAQVVFTIVNVAIALVYTVGVHATCANSPSCMCCLQVELQCAALEVLEVGSCPQSSLRQLWLASEAMRHLSLQGLEQLSDIKIACRNLVSVSIPAHLLYALHFNVKIAWHSIVCVSVLAQLARIHAFQIWDSLRHPSRCDADSASWQSLICMPCEAFNAKQNACGMSMLPRCAQTIARHVLSTCAYCSACITHTCMTSPHVRQLKWL